MLKALFLKIPTLLLLALCLVFSGSIEAKKVENLYQISIPTDQQNNQARWKASLDGFKKVLVRRSGSQDILNSPEASSGYKKVTSFVQKFEYSSNPEDISRYLITLYFEPRLIDDLIKRANKPLWDFNRPVTILWLAQETSDEGYALNREILTESDDEDNLVTLIKKNAQRRGLPVIFPLMDLEDELQVSKSDVWGRFPSSIVTASQRYSADSLLIGKVYLRGKEWFGQFSYFNNDKKQNIEIRAESIEQLSTQLANELAETLCQQYCVDSSQSEGQELLVNIQNITNYRVFRQIETYLKELSVVHSLQINHIHQDTVTFKLGLLSDENTVIESLSLNRQLKFLEEQVNVKERIEVEGQINLDEEAKEINEQVQLGDEEQAERKLTENHLDLDNISLEELEQAAKLDNDMSVETANKLNTIYYRWIN